MALEVQVVSPEAILWSGEATRVITRTLGGGDIAFLPGHAPFVGALGIGVTEILGAGGETVKVAVHGGFVEVSDNRVSILSDVAELADDIDAERARRAKERLEHRQREDKDDENGVALQRAETRLRAVGA